ncbi:MAG TPA: CHAT domain-containing protein [Ramlibacter sp.]|nr:CHAT domain-containing protein [Ramlibacter sp.]
MSNTANKLSPEAIKTISFGIAGERRFKIAYIIPHLPQQLEDASFFGWYTEGLHEAAQPLLVAAKLPADVREPHTDAASVLLHRLTGTIWPLVTPIELPYLQEAMEFIATPFCVLMTTRPEVAVAVDELRARIPTPVLHASTISGRGRTSLVALDAQVIERYVREVLDSLARKVEWSSFVRYVRQELNRAPLRTARKHPLRSGLHNVVAPNEAALEAFGWKLVGSNRISLPIMINPNPQKYVDRICQSADAVAAERARLLDHVTPDIHDHRLALVVPSIFWGLYGSWKEKLGRAPADLRPHLKKALRQIVHASTYFDDLHLSDGSGAQVPEPVQRLLLHERAKDMKSFTATLTAVSATTMTPMLRLEPKLNAVRSKVNDLAHCVRVSAQPRVAWKSSRLAKELGSLMRERINPAFLERIDAVESAGRIEGLKLICDVPLEFLPSRGMQLGMRFDCSRVSPLPGNLSHQICSQPPAFVPVKAFDQVLVLRSFGANDPIRRLFEGAVHIVAEGIETNRVTFNFVDVESADEIAAALKNYQGALLIFDCHGTYEESSGLAALVIGGKPLNIWELKKQCEVPPIVMFSACDTQPMDGSHASVATGAFVLGARAVLGTYFPISARKAALFNARMLWRLEAYIPAALQTRKMLTWREVVAGMLRMSYVTEVLELLEAHADLHFGREEVESIQLATTTLISARDAGWHSLLVTRIAETAKVTEDRVRELMERWCSLTDAMKYVQLGNPERVIIIDAPFEEAWEAASDEVHGLDLRNGDGSLDHPA